MGSGSVPNTDDSGLVARVLAATGNRDRVLDAVKAAALLAVVVGHSLAWHITPAGSAVNVLELNPGLRVLTWIFQVLPLFFAAGAVSNAASLGRTDPAHFRLRRTRRLVTPVLVYATFWTVVLLPLGLFSDQVVGAGRFLSQLLWFAGVYTLVVVAAPVTRRWASRPLLTLAVWFCVICLVDAARIAGAPSAIGWLNLLLVWGWLHQLGYSLPQLRQAPRSFTGMGALLALGAALALALLGPYSTSLVTIGGDPELSNLSPPSVVLALYGCAQVLALAAVWPVLARALSHDRFWSIVALVGARGMGIYLWHIPLVGGAAGIALATGWSVAPLSLPWWLVHVAVVVVVVPLAWLIAGVAARGESKVNRLPRWFGLPPLFVGLAAGFIILNISVTGFATWLGAGMLGLPSTALANLAALVLCWQATSRMRTRGPVDAPAPAS